MVTALAAALVVAGTFGAARDVEAQAADQKRALKAQKAFYKEPGMMDVDIRAMRDVLMITGSVPDEMLIKKADELGGKVRGVKDVRNRLNVKPSLQGDLPDEQITANINKLIEEDEDLARARRKFEFKVENGNVWLDGKLPDYIVAQGFIGDLRRMKGVKTIDFSDLKY